MNDPRFHAPKLLTPSGAFNVRATLVVIVIALLAAVGVSIGFTIKSQRDDNKLWCTVLPWLDEPVPSPSVDTSVGPLTQREQRIAEGLHTIRTHKCGNQEVRK